MRLPISCSIIALLISAAVPVAAQTRRAAPARASLEIHVTDPSGTDLGEVQISVTGPAVRTVQTDPSGIASLRGLPSGVYRLRFEHTASVTLEREITIAAGKPASIDVSLSPAPPPPAPAPAPAPPPPAPRPDVPKVQSATIHLPEFIEKNFVGRAARKDTVIACAPGATAVLQQLREPLVSHVHAEAEVMLYVIAGEGVHRIGDSESRLTAGTFSLVPRGVAHSITRTGSNPVVVLSIEAGAPCSPGAAPGH